MMISPWLPKVVGPRQSAQGQSETNGEGTDAIFPGDAEKEKWVFLEKERSRKLFLDGKWNSLSISAIRLTISRMCD
jgi:hypothetical protein